jgi:hypothetical protein
MTAKSKVIAMENALLINKAAYDRQGKALSAACRRLMRTCPDKGPIMRRECRDTVPTRKSCAERMKAYLLRRAR